MYMFCTFMHVYVHIYLHYHYVHVFYDVDPDKRIQAVKIKDAPTVASTVSVDELSKVAKSLKLEAPPLSTGMMRRAGSSHSLDGKIEV